MHHPSRKSDRISRDGGLEVIPFKADHLSLIAWRDFDRKYTITLPSWEGSVERLSGQGSLGLTVMCEGRILACGGILQLSRGIGYLWLFGSVYLPDHALSFTRELKAWLEQIQDTLDLHRLQTVCVASDEQGRKWVELLGFTQEGILAQYDDNRTDYVMYARLKGVKDGN